MKTWPKPFHGLFSIRFCLLFLVMFTEKVCRSGFLLFVFMGQRFSENINSFSILVGVMLFTDCLTGVISPLPASMFSRHLQ